MKKLVSIMTACYNEEENVRALRDAVAAIMKTLPQYDYEHIFIDNASEDSSPAILTDMAREDPNVKIIFNAKNFGHIRSPYHGLIQAGGDAVISLVADFQDPPEMIPRLLEEWEGGKKVVVCVKKKSKENPLVFLLRRLYYRIMTLSSEVGHIENFTGFGLYDKDFIDVLRRIDDPYPYFRGIVAEYAFDKSVIEYVQPRRRCGNSKNNFSTLFDMALLGMVNHTKMPLRILTLTGFFLSILSFATGMYYLILKLTHWDTIEMGITPILVAILFLGSVQMLFMGLIGEYVGAIYTQTRKRPRVVERGRLNF